MHSAMLYRLITTIIQLLCGTIIADAALSASIIPGPQVIKYAEGHFQIHPGRSVLGLFRHGGTEIIADASGRDTGVFLANQLRKSTGYEIPIGPMGSENGNILITSQDADPQLGDEGYQLLVTSNSVTIRAPQPAGMFYGAQTLLQLFPPEIFSSNTVQGITWQAPCGLVRDWPRFKWRGFMLDVSRHFFNKSEVETVLDLMAQQKLNTFHWHLVDDQGWRIEIKKYPKLTQVGAWRASVGFNLASNSTSAYGPDGRYGGFYTQDDIREVVKYAASRHIMVVPEIEMPGHSTAALTAYPEYSSKPGPLEIRPDSDNFYGVYDPANEGTYQFLDDVLAEVIPLFPGPYIHIGGDEVPRDIWKNRADCQALMKREGLKNETELQSWFTRRMEKIVEARGRTIIGWSEILQGGLATNAVVMDWIGGAKEATDASHYVVMTPTAYCYFDFYQSTNRAA